MVDVVGLGELLIDFTPAGVSDNGNVLFERNPGGAPANVLAALSKLGVKTAFIGKVGQDQFGYYLKETLEKSNIDTSNLMYSKEVNTTLAFVHLFEDGDRDFSFYRKPGADLTLNKSDLNEELLKKTKVFHFGSLSMTGEPSREATLEALNIAKINNCIISYDPNLRESLWEDLDIARTTMLSVMKGVHILKISEEELHFLTGIEDLEEGSKHIYHSYNIPLIIVTLGSKGCYFRKNEYTKALEPYTVNAIDTTGAGDAFLGALLYKVLQLNKEIYRLSIDEIIDALDFANASGALVATKRGAIPAMSTIYEIDKLRGKK